MQGTAVDGKLPVPEKSGEVASIILVVMEKTINPQKYVNPPPTRALPVFAYRVDRNGAQVKKVQMDTSVSGLNINEYFASGASMVWDVSKKRVGMLIARQMIKGGDGLNHQGCVNP